MGKDKKDDLETIRIILDALKPFDAKECERIIRWVCEKLEVGVSAYTPTNVIPTATPIRESVKDIKSFVAKKKPKNDKQFCAVVAYFYQFEALEKERKDYITQKDLTEATRKADWERLKRPDQTLVNAYQSGFFDKLGVGKYKLNSVGENLVAMVLPSGTPEKKPSHKKKAAKKTKKRK